MPAKKKTNLSELKSIQLEKPEDLKVGIVVANWNEEITGTLLKGCLQTLEHYGLKLSNIKRVEVPGSFELPMGAKSLLTREKWDAIICLGCVIKGETPHNQYINSAVSSGLMNLSLASNTPCIFGVLTPLNMEQALERAGGKHGNKGVEAAIAALEMIALDQQLDNKSRSIGFMK